MTRHSLSRWRARSGFETLRVAALADGMMDAVILLCSELVRRPKDLQWDYWDNRQRNTVDRSLTALEADAASFNADRPDAAQITTACGVGWIEFCKEILGIDWREGRPTSSVWFDAFSQRASMQNSMPVAHS
jgi:glutathione S-transferase